MHKYVVLQRGRDDSTLFSLRAYKQNQNGSTHLLLRHPLLHPILPGMLYEYLSSCAVIIVGFERIFTRICESFFFVVRVLHNGLLTKRYVPPSEGKSCTYVYTRTAAVPLVYALVLFFEASAASFLL